MRSMFGNGAWECRLCDVRGDIGNQATEEQTLAALYVHMATEEHLRRSADEARGERIRQAAPEMLDLLREIEADFTCGDWRAQIRALLARIDGAP